MFKGQYQGGAWRYAAIPFKLGKSDAIPAIMFLIVLFLRSRKHLVLRSKRQALNKLAPRSGARLRARPERR